MTAKRAGSSESGSLRAPADLARRTAPTRTARGPTDAPPAAQSPSSREMEIREKFRVAVDRFPAKAPLLLMGHHDADGLSALALLARAFQFNSRPYRVRIVGRGENPWSPDIAAELEKVPLGGIIAADLGVRPGAIKAGVRTILIDHHVPMTATADGVVISGYGLDPVPTSSLIAYWCAAELAPNDP